MEPEPWLPARFTPSLSGTEVFASEWDRWAPFFRFVWLTAFGITFDPWQEWLLRHLMEVYPDGHARAGELRFRQVFVSLGRQNGKSEIAAVIGLWGLLRKANSTTVGIASNADQATIVFNRARKAISLNPELAAMFSRVTLTRGLELEDGALYVIKPAKTAALQGIPVHTGILDEVHLLPAALWADMTNGTGARPNTFVLGITTAGDDDSELLLELYEKAAVAIAGDLSSNRFGAFVWEAPEARVPDDDDELLALLRPANPRLASGLVDPEIFLADVRSTTGGKPGIIRYRLNRFVRSVEALFDPTEWEGSTRPADQPFPAGPLVFCVDQTPERSYASVGVSTLVDGVSHSELVAWYSRPTLEQLVRVCEELYRRHSPVTFAVDSFNKQLISELKRRGIPVTPLGLGDWMNGAALILSRMAQRTFIHGNDPLLSVQVPQTRRKNVGESGFRITRADSSTEIDGVLAIVGSLLLAETADDSGLVQVF